MTTLRPAVYVAGAITKGDVVENVKKAHAAGTALLKAGFAVVVPHGSVFFGNETITSVTTCEDDTFREKDRKVGFVIDVLADGIPYETWIDHSLELVRRCDCLLRLEGESRGADLEEAEANLCGMPVYRSVDEAVAALESLRRSGRVRR